MEGLTQDVPVIKVSSVEDALRRFAVSFYNYPSRKMLMVGVTGALSFCLVANDDLQREIFRACGRLLLASAQEAFSHCMHV